MKFKLLLERDYRRSLYAVIVVNSLDIISTYTYISMDPNAGELSPFYALGLVPFLVIKSVLVPMLFWHSRKIFDIRDHYEFAIFICIFYGMAVLNNTYNIISYLQK